MEKQYWTQRKVIRSSYILIENHWEKSKWKYWLLKDKIKKMLQHCKRLENRRQKKAIAAINYLITFSIGNRNRNHNHDFENKN